MSVAAVVRAALVAVGGGNGGVAAVRLLLHGRAELVVVGADEPERGLRVDGKVEQRLMQLRLPQLLGVPAGPDRLTDPPRRTARSGPVVDELPPRGNDPRRVATELGDVDKADLGGLGAETVAHPVEMLRRQRRHHRLPGGQTTRHERHQAVQIVAALAPHERFVTVALMGPSRSKQAHKGLRKPGLQIRWFE